MHSGTAQVAPASVKTRNPSAMVLLLLAVVGLYLVLHPYLGITHDARLYTLQALNHLQPELYGNDIFLRYGSQDDYTLFTPLYAWVISWLGVEPAASLLTLMFQVAFLGAAVWLARSLFPSAHAWAAIVLLLALPDHYGPSRIFSYFEEFVTPRQLAESLVLLGLVAWLRGSRKLSFVLLIVAMLSHPIMGLAGVALLATLYILPYWRKSWSLAAIASVSIALIVVFNWLPSHWRFDRDWLEIVLARAKYLRLGSWSSDDWGRVATVAGTLVIAARVLSSKIQRLVVATLISGGALMLLAFIGGDLLKIQLIVQAQPWRVLWLATVLAIVVLPAIALECWRGATLQRASLLLLAAAWLSPSENLSLLMAPLAVAAVARRYENLDRKYIRLILLGSHAVTGMILFHAVAVSALSIRGGAYNVSVSPWLDILRNSSAGGSLPLVLLAAGWWIARTIPRIALPLVAATATLPVAATAGKTAGSTWLDTTYDEDLKAEFSGWRARIPPGSDVLWITDRSLDSDSTTNVWLLLERPSFASRIQASTSLFSRDAAIEMHRRAQSLFGLLPHIGLLYPKGVEPPIPEPLLLAPVCRTSQVKYIVTPATFVDAKPIEAPANVRYPFSDLKLYICP